MARNGQIARHPERPVAAGPLVAVVAAGLPVVAVGGGGAYAPESRIPYVATDNEAIATAAAEHLLERALQHFGYYGLRPSPTSVWSEARAAAFKHAIAKAGRTSAVLLAWHDCEGRGPCQSSRPWQRAVVAPRAGFRSIAYMTTVLSRHNGTTPAALRTAARGGH
jgi:hypothetical protein